MSTRPKICLIYTGGTIGMIREPKGEGYILRPPEDPSEFLRYLKTEEEIRELAELDCVALLNKDSTNMVPADWTRMAQAIYQRLDRGYQGFVITHGTDTMHFSASALAFAFGDRLNLPIVFTGAQTIPAVVHGDARVNLLRAVKVACEDLAEVVVAFGESVFRGCRVQKKDARRFDAFESPAESPIGSITEEILLATGRVRMRRSRSGPLEFHPGFADGVVQFSLIPGLEPEALRPVLHSDRCKGVILQSFGAGNVPNAGSYSFRGFIREAVSLDKPVVITSQLPATSTLASPYAPGREALEAGAIPSGDMTNAAATTKLRWVLHQIQSAIDSGSLAPTDRLARVREMMGKVYVGEMTPSDAPRGN
ncbi:asparaginase [Candidatus Thiosymbion oneisti]|uniref:asparaginase n=1 Tax=Candidatus Thiosymbion oneisti TaxID=589554 RepID=UPI000AFFB1EE|nr:asparaginase [Candidatus Thiosymbion oneisti]